MRKLKRKIKLKKECNSKNKIKRMKIIFEKNNKTQLWISNDEIENKLKFDKKKNKNN
jgi:hypothetical protein